MFVVRSPAKTPISDTVGTTERDLNQEPADQEDGRLAPQNNHLVGSGKDPDAGKAGGEGDDRG